jgi:LmbE family N-acetylglucosaminyl deacetylase
MNALVVVAHDDAVLWVGGTIHHLKHWNWHAISMCNQGNDERKRYFEETCNKLSVRADTLDFLDYQDSNAAPKRNSIAQMKESLLSVVGAMMYDYVFTQSRDPNGEYSYHANHQEVCEVVGSLVLEGRLVQDTSRLAHFCYRPIYNENEPSGLATVATRDADYYFQLTYSDLAFKVELIRSHTAAIVNNLECALSAPCPNPEAFEGDGLSLPNPFIRRR